MSNQPETPHTSGARPNVLFFFTDDQRFDTIRAWDNEHIHTPNIDRWVKQGTSFTRAHIMGGTSPAVCMPSRAMLMTGRTLFHLRGAGEDIPLEHVLLGEHLQKQGYRTFGTGKWHNGPSAYARSFSAGAEIFFGGMEDHWNVPACRFDPRGRYDVFKSYINDPWTNNRLRERLCDHITPGKHSSELFCDAAIDFLRTYDAPTPFFMYLSFMAPHDPRSMPRDYLEMYDPGQIELPPNFMAQHPFDNGELWVRDELLTPHPRQPDEIRRHIAEYYAMITHADAQIGRVLHALREAGQAENTIIVFAGDNGLALGQHGLMGKQNLYDHSIRVPLVFWGPGVPQGLRSEAHGYLIDIYPTLCDLLGLPVPDSVEGKSLVPAMRDPNHLVRDTMYFGYKEFQRCVRDRRFKLIEYVVQGQRTTQLFDTQQDPWELINLVAESAYAADVERLRHELVQWGVKSDDRSNEFGRVFWEGLDCQSRW